MRTDAAALRSGSSPLLILFAVVLLAAVAAVAYAAPQQADQVVEEEGLRLVRHADDTYELSADAVPLEALVAHFVTMSEAEFSVAPELLRLPVTMETDRVGLGPLLEQLRASLEANLILAANRQHVVSRVWLTPTSLTASAEEAAAPASAGGTPAGTPQVPPPPSGAMPTPTGNEITAAGFDPSVDMAAFIRSRAAAASSPTGAPAGAQGAAGAPPTAPGAEGTAEPPQAQNAPPIPMDPNALESYFAGDSTTNTYHRLNCIQAMYLPAANKVWFKSRQEAVAAGYTPHEICVAR